MKRQSFKMFALVLLLSLGTVLTFGCADTDGNNGPVEETKVTLSYGGIQSTEDATTKAMHKMAELVAEKSGGSLEIEVYPASQLGDAISQMEGVMMGSQDMFIDAASFIAQFVPDKQVDSLFFAFSDEEHFKTYLNDELMAKVEEEFLQERNVRVIDQGYLRAPRVMVSKSPINSLEDMSGLKMRVPEIRTYLESVSALGANPTQIAWGEVYLALSQGVVDAAEGPLDAVYSMKFHEGAPYITMTNHIRDNLAVMINEDVFQGMSENQQQALVEAAAEAGEWYSDQVSSSLAETVEKLKSEDAIIIEDVDIEPFVNVMVETATKLEDEGVWAKGLFEQIQGLK
ncbi:MAG: hypothetical protein APF76_15955 [Desulfitibacter sp. BRH_c19]|nr:MAG: hypothetical protein APF76_15955 [Desulfitibacter sp. BRH_c19]